MPFQGAFFAYQVTSFLQRDLKLQVPLAVALLLLRVTGNQPSHQSILLTLRGFRNGCKAAFLIEHGFHTCPKDASFLLSSANLKKLAKAEAQVIADYFGANKQVYVAQVVKAFDSQSAAEAYRDKLIADGYDAVIFKA